MLVIDANVAIWSFLPALSPEEVDALSRLIAWQQDNVQLAAPMLWWPECTSAIRRAVHTHAISDDIGRVAMSDLLALEVQTHPIDYQQSMAAFEWAGRLKQSKAYDAFYLALAEQLGVEFWTGDKRLSNAAQQAGASWVHWIGED